MPCGLWQMRAVLLHRLVGMHERPALLGVTLVAGLDGAVALHELATRRSRAGCGNPSRKPCLRGSGGAKVRLHFGALLLVAREAHFGLRELDEHLVRARASCGRWRRRRHASGACCRPSANASQSLLWQAMHSSLASVAEHRLAARIVDPPTPRPPPAFTCSVASPWQLEHSPVAAGPRTLAFLPVDRMRVRIDLVLVAVRAHLRSGTCRPGSAGSGEAECQHACGERREAFPTMRKRHCGLPFRSISVRNLSGRAIPSPWCTTRLPAKSRLHCSIRVPKCTTIDLKQSQPRDRSRPGTCCFHRTATSGRTAVIIGACDVLTRLLRHAQPAARMAARASLTSLREQDGDERKKAALARGCRGGEGCF